MDRFEALLFFVLALRDLLDVPARAFHVGHVILPLRKVEILAVEAHKRYVKYRSKRPKWFAVNSHIETVAYLRTLMFAQVLHDLSYFPSALNCNGVLAIELRVVPIHFGKTKDFLTDYTGRLI